MVVKANRTSFLHRYGHHNTETMISTNPIQTGRVSSFFPTVGHHRLSNDINPVISHVGVNDGIVTENGTHPRLYVKVIRLTKS